MAGGGTFPSLVAGKNKWVYPGLPGSVWVAAEKVEAPFHAGCGPFARGNTPAKCRANLASSHWDNPNKRGPDHCSVLAGRFEFHNVFVRRCVGASMRDITSPYLYMEARIEIGPGF